MNKGNKTYKEGDLVKIRTNKCNVHLMEMFGHCQFNPDEISHSEYIALITAVIENGAYYSVTIFAPHGECYHVIDEEEVLGPSSVDDLPKEKREISRWRSPIEKISYNVLGQDLLSGLSLNTKRMTLAIAAVNHLHSEGKIRVVKMAPSQSFLRAAINKNLDVALAQSNLSGKRQKELEEKKEQLAQWANSLHFEEHYEYHIGVDKSDREAYEEPNGLVYYIVAVNEDATKAFVMGTRDEQNDFFNYMGPDFKNLYIEANIFRNDCKK